jgi:hypothetical protein
MGRPKGFTTAGLYPRDKHIRIPCGATEAVRQAVWCWEVSRVREDVAEVQAMLRAAIANAKPKSKSHAKAMAKARKKAKA